MRILLATDAWEPQVNGVVRTLTRVVAELREMGDKVEVISPDQFPNFPLPTYPEIKLAVGAYEKVQERFKSFEPEAIHIATEGPIGLAARRICIEWKLPFTTSYHTRFPEYVSARLPVPLAAGYAYMKWFHRPSGRLMVATPTLRDELSRHGFRNLSQWSRGVDTELFHPRQTGEADPYAGLARPIFLNVGRVAVEKNIEAFVSLDLPGTKVWWWVMARSARSWPPSIRAWCSPAPGSARSWRAISPARTSSCSPRSPTASAWSCWKRWPPARLWLPSQRPARWTSSRVPAPASSRPTSPPGCGRPRSPA
jgi:hypothetical protein